MDELEKLDQIEKILKGEATAEDSSMAPETLKQELNLHAAIFQGIADAKREEMFLHFDDLEVQAKQAEQESAQRGRAFYLNRNWGIAASLLFLLAAYFVIQLLLKPSPEKLFAEHYTKYPNYVSNTLRGEENTAEANAFDLYTQGEYAAALEAFEALERPNIGEKFYWALSLLELGDFEAARDKLKNAVLKAPAHDFTNPALWYLALVEIKIGNIKFAKVHLNYLIDQKTDYQEKASALMNKL